MPTKVTTAWGPATIAEEFAIQQRAGEKRFTSHVQLLEGGSRELLVRFAYSTGGATRRGPVTLRERDLAKLRAALADHPRLAKAFGFGKGGA